MLLVLVCGWCSRSAALLIEVLDFDTLHKLIHPLKKVFRQSCFIDCVKCLSHNSTVILHEFFTASRENPSFPRMLPSSAQLDSWNNGLELLICYWQDWANGQLHFSTAYSLSGRCLTVIFRRHVILFRDRRNVWYNYYRYRDRQSVYQASSLQYHHCCIFEPTIASHLFPIRGRIVIHSSSSRGSASRVSSEGSIFSRCSFEF